MRNQKERLSYLVEKFKEDSFQYRELEVGKSEEEQRMVLRSLMNIRMPGAMQEEVIKVQDEFLQQEAVDKGIVGLSDLPTIAEEYHSAHPFAGKLSIWKGDITRLGVDAIVNAANSQMLGCFVPCHKCIDNAIHSAAGIELREECNQRMQAKRIQYGPRFEEPTGQALITKGYNLPANYVIHTVGPIVGWKLNESLRQKLRSCYENVLKCALEHKVRSLAFCCISTGEFHFPNQEAAEIAVETVSEFLNKHEDAFERIIFNVFQEIDKKIYEKLLQNEE